MDLKWIARQTRQRCHLIRPFLAFGFLLFCWLCDGAGKAEAANRGEQANNYSALVDCPDSIYSACTIQDRNLENYSLPDLQTLPPFDFQLIYNRSSGDRLLRFSNSVANRGEGILELHGRFNQEKGVVEVNQQLFQGGSITGEHRLGEFIFHPEHGHWHWEDFSIYEIWTVRPDGNPNEIAVTSGKVGYCMLDSSRLNDEQVKDSALSRTLIPDTRQYAGCGWRRQGISAGWMDTYYRYTPGQVLDLSDLEDGLYVLRSTVDPQGLLIETNNHNNTAEVYFTIYGGELRVFGEELRAHCWKSPENYMPFQQDNQICK
jgi:hypothetical protein